MRGLADVWNQIKHRRAETEERRETIAQNQNAISEKRRDLERAVEEMKRARKDLSA